MRLSISHHTRYRFEAPVEYALQRLRLTPHSGKGQEVISWKTLIEGGHVEVEYDDHYGNRVMLVRFDPGHNEISVTCSGEVETRNANGVAGHDASYTPLWYFQRSTPLTRAGRHVHKLLKTLGRDFEGDLALLHGLSSLITSEVAYETGKTHPGTRAEDALEAGHGVCQDHAHIFVSAARTLGYPARYVSGYLMMDDRVDQEATHAWAEAHVNGLGWVGFDISNGISPDERYVRVAVGLDYQDAAPITGLSFGGRDESMVVSIQVQQ